MKFDSYHPTINLIYFTGVISSTILFKHPVFVAISFLSAFCYSLKLNGKRAFIFNLCLIPILALWVWWYSYYNHFGITVLSQNFIDNSITLEAVVYGLVIGLIACGVVMWASCVHAVVSTDKIIYLFGRISPKLSLFISIILRMVPKIKSKAKKINDAQKAIGRGSNQGNMIKRICNCFRQASIIITWSIENFAQTSDSMRCRGYGLRGRTAFSIYRFDNRDRSFVVSLFWLLIILLTAALFDQVNILYDPQIVFNKITLLSYLFYFAYMFFCLLPMNLQIAGEEKFKRCVKKARQ